jgi:hypothetical protein
MFRVSGKMVHVADIGNVVTGKGTIIMEGRTGIQDSSQEDLELIQDDFIE